MRWMYREKNTVSALTNLSLFSVCSKNHNNLLMVVYNVKVHKLQVMSSLSILMRLRLIFLLNASFCSQTHVFETITTGLSWQ